MQLQKSPEPVQPAEPLKAIDPAYVRMDDPEYVIMVKTDFN